MLMKSLLLLFFAVTVNCNCIYKGSYSKVTWSEPESVFKDVPIKFGEQMLSVNFTCCDRKNNFLKLSGKIESQDMLIGNSEFLQDSVTVYLCNNEGKVLEDMFSTTLEGDFNFEIKFDKELFLVFTDNKNNEGIK